MEVDKPIRSRKPIRYVGNDSHSPHGSPNTPRRRHFRQMSPDYSGSDNENAIEGRSNDYDSDQDVSSSTVNSSLDAPDGQRFEIVSRDHEKYKYDEHERIREYSRIKQVNMKITQPSVTSNNNWLYVVVVLVAIIILSGVCCKLLILNDPTSSPRKFCSFDIYREQFPNQDGILWKSLQKGVENVLNDVPVSPSIFLLAYQDITTAYEITRKIVRRTTECMQSTVNAVVLTSDDLNSDEMRSDYGIVIKKYKSKLANSGVMLVNDLNKVLVEVAPAFHAFCDVHNPLVDRSVIFLTVQLDQQATSLLPSHSPYTSTLQIVENYLRSNWSKLERYTLDPLITRVTDQVFLINKE